MVENNINEKKLDILRDLLVDEGHTIDDLKRLVIKSKPFIQIGSKTGKILISHNFPFRVVERVILYLIGIYFSKELNLNLDLQITSRNISEGINAAQTTLSGQLGELVNKNIVSKNEGSYTIKYYEIEKTLDHLSSIYLANNDAILEKAPHIKPKMYKKNKITKKPNLDKNQLKVKEFNEEIFNEIIRKCGLDKDELDSIFSIDKHTIILIRGFRGDGAIETHIKSTLLSLTANKIYFGLDEINSSELRRILENSGVDRLTPLSTNLKKFPNYVIHRRGAIGSTNNTYRLTNLGFQKGIMILNDIINNTKDFKLDIKPRIKRELLPPISIEENKLMQNITEFSRENDLEEEKLKITFDFQTDNLRLLKKPTEKTRKIIQIKSLMMLGVILKRVYHANSFSGGKLLRDSHISNDRLDLLDSNKDYNTYFSKKPKTAMQLTYAGELKAIEMVKELAA
ncbi:MAG: hypothetical protein KAK00_10930 [Nanoarchaeota archaeon]|nr:hypothetical protein [Nanoarchaeota archaeon]